MARRHPNHRLIKLHRCYTVEEISTVLDVHKNTTRDWFKKGLDRIDQKRPILVLGSVLVAFLKARRKSAKHPCKPGQLYCLRCRQPRAPAEGVVYYHPYTDVLGDLVGTCPTCQGGLRRRTSLPKLKGAIGDLLVRMPQAEEDIGDTAHLSLNCDFKQDA